MKIKTLYTCEICRTDFAEKKEAEKCEKEHVNPKMIYDFRVQAHGKYPTKIEVEFADGSKHWYRA